MMVLLIMYICGIVLPSVRNVFIFWRSNSFLAYKLQLRVMGVNFVQLDEAHSPNLQVTFH